MKRIVLILGLFLFGVGTAFSQESMWSFNYTPASPIGDLQEYTNATSLRGWAIDGRRFMTDNVSLGGYIGYNGFFEERPRQLYDIDNTTINAITYRYLYVVPVLINSHYYIGEGWIRPYAGLGLGIYYVEQELQFNTFRIQEKNWRFGLAPEVGVLIPFGVGATTGVMLGAKFNQVSYNVQGIDNLNYINYNLGIGFSF